MSEMSPVPDAPKTGSTWISAPNMVLAFGIGAVILTIIFLYWTNVPPVDYRHFDPRAADIDGMSAFTCFINFVAIAFGLVVWRLAATLNRGQGGSKRIAVGITLAMIALVVFLCTALPAIATISFAGSGD